MSSTSNPQICKSVGSSATSSGRGRGRVLGIPLMCWCGHSIVELTSKSVANPGRVFYRCAYAAAQKLKNDAHIFKWMDEAILERGDEKSQTLEEELMQMKDIMAESIEFKRKRLEKLCIEVEERLIERIEVAISDAKTRLWKTMCIVVPVGVVLIVGFTNLFG